MIIILLLISLSSSAQVDKQFRIKYYIAGDEKRVVCDRCLIAIDSVKLQIKIDGVSTFKITDVVEGRGKTFYMLEQGFFMVQGNFTLLETRRGNIKFILKKENVP